MRNNNSTIMAYIDCDYYKHGCCDLGGACDNECSLHPDHNSYLEEQEKLKVILANCQYDSNIACGKQKISCTINCINHPSHFAEEFARYEYKHKYERFLKANGLKDGAYARNLFDEVYDDI